LFQFFRIYFLKTTWVSLVNIILGRWAVAELIQSDFKLEKVVNELGKILHDPAHEKRMLADYSEMMIKLGEPGASKRAAELMVEKLK
jgi:lipid-A-disaccharide synthase